MLCVFSATRPNDYQQCSLGLIKETKTERGIKQEREREREGKSKSESERGMTERNKES